MIVSIHLSSLTTTLLYLWLVHQILDCISISERIVSLSYSSFSFFLRQPFLFLLFLNQTKVTSNLTANFLKILQLSLKFLSCITLIIQLLLQLRDISSSTHLTDLRWSWLEFGSGLKRLLQICDLVSGLLLIPLLLKSSIIFWIFYFEIIEVGGNEFFFSFLHRCSNL